VSNTQLALDLGHRPALAMDDFIVAPSNSQAVQWIDRWRDWPAPALVVYGPPGCGKTHLAHVFRAMTGAVLLSPDILDEAEPPALLGGHKYCVLGDAGRTCESREERVLHLFNLVAEQGGRMLMTARRAPARWGIELPDLRSRVNAVPAIEVSPPEEALIAAVLGKMFDDRQLRVQPGVIDFLVARIERSFAASRRAVAMIDESALAARRNVTLPFVRDVLRANGMVES
jgi:DnaA regulatory inactivator Hda